MKDFSFENSSKSKSEAMEQTLNPVFLPFCEDPQWQKINQEHDEATRKRKEERVQWLVKFKGYDIEKAMRAIQNEDENSCKDKEIEKKLEEDALKFEYFPNKIIDEIKPINTSSKARIRYIIQRGIGTLNYNYRNKYFTKKLLIERSHSESLYNIYDITKSKIWHLRYSDADYFNKLSAIYREYLDGCYDIFLNFLKTSKSIKSSELINKKNILSIIRKNSRKIN
jgi:hypothetical protein